DDEGRGEHVHAAVAHRVCRLALVDRDRDLCGGADIDIHEDRFYRGNRSECKPIRISSTSMMERNTRSLIRSSSRRPTHEPANIAAPSKARPAKASHVSSA